jgi:antitoxin (DNA-binding transcriptional repressor) of toxin-antitoxin stability system
MYDTPTVYTELVARLGPPLGVEEARVHWGRLVRAAQDGHTTLITRERWEWAALVPLSGVPGPLTGLPALPLSTVRRKLGDLVRQAAQPSDSGPMLLTRHRNPVAALVSAHHLADRREHRLAPEDLLRDGNTILLTQLPGPAYSAVARDSDGNPIATGLGESVNEALRRLRPPEAGA